MQFLLFLALLIGVTFSADNCQQDTYDDFIVQLETIKTSCGNETVFNCESHMCISKALDLGEAFNIFFTECSTQIQSNPSDVNELKNYQTLEGCNQCVVLFTQFEKVQEQMNEIQCPDTTNVYNCDNECVEVMGDYVDRYHEMLEGICRPNNPGGCDDMVGMTEGELYDKLNAMVFDIEVLKTRVSLCNDGCTEQVQNWHHSWKALDTDGCLSSHPEVDFENDSIALTMFQLDPQCETSCQENIIAAVKEFMKIPSECVLGLTTTHKDILYSSIDESFCTAPSSTWDQVKDAIVARGFFTLSLVCIGGVLIYILCTMCYRRCYLKKKGWAILPTFGRRKQSKHQHNLKNFNEDEEMLVGLDDDEEDGL